MKKFNFEFTLDECNIILRGLAELPYKTSYQVINLITTQFTNQNKEKNNPQVSQSEKVTE